MKRESLNTGWEYVEAALQNPLLVNMLQSWKKTDLPHDYSMEKGRDPHSVAGPAEGFFQGAGLYYRKSFRLKDTAAGKRIWLEFEGISGMTEIWVNKIFVAKHLNPYTSICIDVTDVIRIGENEIMLHTDSRMKPNSRWYVGAGLYRPVWLYVGEKGCIRPHGLKCQTVSLTPEQAVLKAWTDTEGAVLYQLFDGEYLVASATDGCLTVPDPQPWSPDTPKLYTLRATVNGDTSEERIGIRTIAVNPKDGFLLNGKPFKLRGGCIHHDLGLLGAADYDAAQRRRIRILKESGFNAIRCAHNPFGPVFLMACDELGMLVIEEAFDEWVLGRTSFGLHMTFEDRWEQDLEDMIDRDYNHPCIFLWSIGNEVEERDGSADGYAWSRKLAKKVKSLDGTRPVTASACALFSEYGNRPAGGTTGNQALNMAYDAFAEGRDIWGPGTREYFEPLDVASYNYKSVRYAYDREKYPDRVICGSESYPRAAYRTWQDTAANPHVIGDFVWTAWDYLGEAGLGRWEVSDQRMPTDPAWPWMTAGCSDMDLIGQKRPQSYLRDAVWGEKDVCSLFSLPPELTGKKLARLSWGWLPVEPNYSFPGMEGSAMEAHVYTNGDEAELIQNGVSLGRQPVLECAAHFHIVYQPGVLTAVSYRNGVEIGRDTLKTAGKAEKVELQVENSGLGFVRVRALDANGTPVFRESGQITVSVQGGTLLALGTADPKPDCVHPFTGSSVPLYQGQALAIIKGTGKAVVKVCFAGRETEAELTFDTEKDGNRYVSEAKSSAVDRPLGELLENEKAAAMLKAAFGQMLSGPMLEAMKGMSLKKLLSMGGMEIPDALRQALEAALM